MEDLAGGSAAAPKNESRVPAGREVKGRKHERASFPLRLGVSLKERAEALAREDGVSLNHFIGLALAEKVSRLEAAMVQKAPSRSKTTMPPS